MEMSDNHFREGSLAGEDGDCSPVEPAVAAAAENVGDSADQVGYGTNETREANDGGREDTFVDCQDEIENSQEKELFSGKDEIENSESQQNYQEKKLVQDNQFHESDSVNKVHEFMTEMDMNHDMQEKNVSEKDEFAQEYEEESVAFRRGLTRLCYQLKVLSEQHSSPIENEDRLVNHFQNENNDWDEKYFDISNDWDEKTWGSGASLNEMIS